MCRHRRIATWRLLHNHQATSVRFPRIRDVRRILLRPSPTTIRPVIRRTRKRTSYQGQRHLVKNRSLRIRFLRGRSHFWIRALVLVSRQVGLEAVAACRRQRENGLDDAAGIAGTNFKTAAQLQYALAHSRDPHTISLSFIVLRAALNPTSRFVVWLLPRAKPKPRELFV